jgi:hypothetical protein
VEEGKQQMDAMKISLRELFRTTAATKVRASFNVYFLWSRLSPEPNLFGMKMIVCLRTVNIYLYIVA